jgi:hypothetical protein
VNIAQRALLTRRGRVTLVVIYVVAAIISIAVYSVMRGLWYGLGQFVVLGLGLGWIIWCLRPRD